MRITRATEYALRAIAKLAETPRRVRSAPDLGGATGLPIRFLAKICAKLAKAGLLRSYPGVGGGYLLARAADQITAWEVVQSVEDDPRLLDCLGPTGSCPRLEQCGVRPFVERAQRAMEAALTSATLHDVMRMDRALAFWPVSSAVVAGGHPPTPASGGPTDHPQS